MNEENRLPLGGKSLEGLSIIYKAETLERLDEMKRLPLCEGVTPRDTFAISPTFRIIRSSSSSISQPKFPFKSSRERGWMEEEGCLLAELRAER